MFTTTINISDINLFVKVFNSNKDAQQAIDPKQTTLILLHGGPGMDHSHYLKTWAKYIDYCQLILLDQRGNGQSDYGAPELWTLQQWADDVAQLCSSIGLQKKPFVGGMSFGATVALNFAVNHPHMPAGLVLSEVDARFNKPQFMDNLKEKAEQDGSDVTTLQQTALAVFSDYNEATSKKYFELIAPYFASKHFNGINDYDQMIYNPACSKHYLEGEFQTMDIRPQLHKIQCPVLILTGDQNPFHSYENAKEVADHLPKELVAFHPFYGEGSELHTHVPDKMMALIKAFIAQHTL